MNPLALISAVSTGIDLLSTVANVISGNSAADAPTTLVGQAFSGILGAIAGTDAQAATAATTGSSLDVIPQGSIGANTQGAVSSLNNTNGDQLSDATLNALNNIVSAQSIPTKPLAESDIKSDGTATTGGVATSTPKLDDPFGIKAAEANGSPIAAPSITPADSNMSDTPVVDLSETLDDSATAAVAASATGANTKAAATANPVTAQAAQPLSIADKNLANAKLVKFGDNVNGDDTAPANIDANSFAAKANERLAELKNNSGSSILTNAAEKAAQDKITDTNSATSTGTTTLVNGYDPTKIGDAVRAARAKDDLRSKMADVDTYKVVSVSKKDNVIDLRLEPSQLGKVQIKMDFTDGKTNVSVIADRPETLQLLQKDTKGIEKILADNGINADSSSLSFDLRGQNQGQQNQEGFNFFSGKPLSFRVQEHMQSMAAANDANSGGYNNYANAGSTGLLNIMV